MIIKIESMTPKLDKEGNQIGGQTKYGPWVIWSINKKYDYFNAGARDLEVGKTYNGTVETKNNGKYTNYTLVIKDHTPIISVDEPETYGTGQVAPDFLQPEGTAETKDQLLMEEIQAFRKEINDRFDSLGHYLSSKLK